MAGTDAVWSAQGTTPEEIEAALRRLLFERYQEKRGYAPARVLNMIVLVDLDWTGEIANRLRGVGRYHASRLVVLAYERKRDRLDARVTIAADSEPEDGQVALLRETVVVELGARHVDDLLTIADPLVVTDLPTLLWAPHGHHEFVAELMPLVQSVLLDSVDEPVPVEALERAWSLSEQVYVVDLAWLRSTPWRERIAGSFDPPMMRRELQTISALTVRHHAESTAAALLMAGWMGSRLDWQPSTLIGRDSALLGRAHASRQDVAIRLEAAPELLVRGLEGVALETATGRYLRLRRGDGGLRATTRDRRGHEREWTIPGASRGESGVLGEGIRQALLRDPTYRPALRAARAMLR
jgi:glucose-6-phosphate dehydrogenase assembly protein OpcA